MEKKEEVKPLVNFKITDVKLKHLVLAMLILILIVPMFNTAHLYGRYSDLEGFEKVTAIYFIGITFELSILLCVRAGYRPVGIFFALVSLVIGLLYHINFHDIRDISFYYEHHFLSKVVIQIGISSLVYVLSEVYVRILNREKQTQEVQNLKSEIKLLNTEKENLTEDLRKLKYDLQNANELLNKRSQLEQEIISLQKQKAGMSRSLTKEN